jgi:protein transport protein SEC61 subunit gamma-like protein
MTDNPTEIIKKQEEMKEKKPSIFLKIKEKISQYKRVINVSRKPSKEEFFSSIKITGSGIALIGVIGFVIFLVYFLVVK